MHCKKAADIKATVDKKAADVSAVGDAKIDAPAVEKASGSGSLTELSHHGKGGEKKEGGEKSEGKEGKGKGG